MWCLSGKFNEIFFFCIFRDRYLNRNIASKRLEQLKINIKFSGLICRGSVQPIKKRQIEREKKYFERFFMFSPFHPKMSIMAISHRIYLLHLLICTDG